MNVFELRASLPLLESEYALPVSPKELFEHKDEWVEFSVKTLKAPVTFALGKHVDEKSGMTVLAPMVVFEDDGDMIYFKMWRAGQ